MNVRFIWRCNLFHVALQLARFMIHVIHVALQLATFMRRCNLFSGEGPPRVRLGLRTLLQGYLAHKKQPAPLGPP